MNIAIVGCGFVFDIYMRTIKAHPDLVIVGVFDIDSKRALAVSEYYDLRVYKSYNELLSDDSVGIVVNLTNIGSHFEVSRKALEAGKHLYSEKPLTKNLEETQSLFSLAEANGLVFHGAPCNLYSDTVRTMFKAVEDGHVGKPLLIYAELDDNPIHLMEFDKVKSPTGAPWPLEEEIREGCTYEHVGYHLVWICALLGPVTSITAFSSELIENKMCGLPPKVGTPDFSVASLSFKCGAVARITCSVVAPRDHRMRIICQYGEIFSEGYRRYNSPVYLEKFSKLSLNARKFSTIRTHLSLARLFGVGGSKQKLVRHWKSTAIEGKHLSKGSIKQRMIEWLRRKEVYAQDKFLGISEMARAIKSDRKPYLSPDFLIHINELTLLIQNAGTPGIATIPTTIFEKIGPLPQD